LLIDFYSPNFEEELDKLDKNKKYIYHCRSGSRSRSAITVFKKLGFTEIYELEGGINN
jgi:rhodanese-related sulfurtransferase